MLLDFGNAANGGVTYYQLDNEPGGWGNTHRDVEPNGADYDTIFTLGSEYAEMIKSTDSTALVMEPSDFTLGGWIGTSADMQEHGSLYAGQWYLQQMQNYYQTAHGTRILDYFDEHVYGGSTTDSNYELQSTRSLWDPTYNSGTWVEQYYFGNMQLIPRFRGWINQYYPGTKQLFQSTVGASTTCWLGLWRKRTFWGYSAAKRLLSLTCGNRRRRLIRPHTLSAYIATTTATGVCSAM